MKEMSFCTKTRRIAIELTGLWRSVLSNMIAQVSIWQASRRTNEETFRVINEELVLPTEVNVVGLQSRYRAAKKCRTRSRSCASPMIVNCLTNFLNARSSVSPWKLNNLTYSSATNWLKSFLKSYRIVSNNNGNNKDSCLRIPYFSFLDVEKDILF